MSEIVASLVEKLKFPKKYVVKKVEINGYGEASMLHWLSQIVWRREHEVLVPNELVCWHVALECLKLEIIPVERSLVQLIAEGQKKVNFVVESGKKLKVESLKRTGFFVIPKFVSPGDLASELKQRVMQCKKRRFVFH